MEHARCIVFNDHLSDPAGPVLASSSTSIPILSTVSFESGSAPGATCPPLLGTVDGRQGKTEMRSVGRESSRPERERVKPCLLVQDTRAGTLKVRVPLLLRS